MVAVSVKPLQQQLSGLAGGLVALHDHCIIRDMIHVAIRGLDMRANMSCNVDGHNLGIGCAFRLRFKVEV
jgi:hypothetical protein